MQRFINTNLQQSYVEGLLKHVLLSPTPEFWFNGFLECEKSPGKLEIQKSQFIYFQSKSKGLRTRKTDVISSSLKAGRLKTQEEPMFLSESKGWKRPAFLLQLSGRRSSLLLSFLFYSCLQLNGWGLSTLGRSTALVSLPIQNINLIQKHPYRHTRKIFDQISAYPMIQLSWYMKLTITLDDLDPAGPENTLWETVF